LRWPWCVPCSHRRECDASFEVLCLECSALSPTDVSTTATSAGATSRLHHVSCSCASWIRAGALRGLVLVSSRARGQRPCSQTGAPLSEPGPLRCQRTDCGARGTMWREPEPCVSVAQVGAAAAAVARVQRSGARLRPSCAARTRWRVRPVRAGAGDRRGVAAAWCALAWTHSTRAWGVSCGVSRGVGRRDWARRVG